MRLALDPGDSVTLDAYYFRLAKNFGAHEFDLRLLRSTPINSILENVCTRSIPVHFMPASRDDDSKRYRRWCFTYFTVDKSSDVYDEWECERLIVGFEYAPTTGSPHHQGYVRFLHPKGKHGVRKMLKEAHWTACKGNEAQNEIYCGKDADLVIDWSAPTPEEECGAEESKQGKRKDIVVAREMIRAGYGMTEIVDKINSYQAMRGAELMLKYAERGRDWVPEVLWIYGPTGSGKSHLAHHLTNGEAWISAETGRWFEGYDAHPYVIFDDLRGDFCKFHVLLRLLDKYPFRIEVKGASRQFLARTIVITSSLPPHGAYNKTGEDLRQLGRRITHVIRAELPGVAFWMPGTSIGKEPVVPYNFCAEMLASAAALIAAQKCASAQEVGGNTMASPFASSDEASTATPLQTHPTSADPPTSLLEQLLEEM